MQGAGAVGLVAAALALAGCQAALPVVAGLRLAAVQPVFQLGRPDARGVAVVRPDGGPAPAVAPVGSPGPAPSPTPTGHGAGGGVAPGPAATPPVRRGGGGRGGGRSAPGPVATTAPTPTPLVNSLDAGPGAMAGVVRDVRAAGAPVPDAAVTIVSAADPSKRAVVATAADGSWQAPGIALGTYLVSVEKATWAAGGAPVEVVLFATSPMALTVNFALAP